MHEELLPLFPLALVLLPDNELPLHIFEDRYKEMIGEALADGTEFGVVLASGEGVATVGCTAGIIDVAKRYPDGRMDILTVGRRRFRLKELDQERTFLRSTVEFYDDAVTETTRDLRERAWKAVVSLPATSPWPGGSAPEIDHPQLSFLLASRVADNHFRQLLLMSDSEPERLRRIVHFVPGYGARARQSERMKEVAPRNGHGPIKPNIEES